MALLDLGGDGDLDVVFTQGLARLADVVTGPGTVPEVYLNDGTGHFGRTTGPMVRGWWTGLASGDFDNDGDTDVVCAGYGSLALWEQRNGGLLEFPQAFAGGLMNPDHDPPGVWIFPGKERELGQIPWWSTSVAFLDADLDGNLDLYVGQYLELDPLDPPKGELGQGALAIPCWWKGLEVFCGPRGLRPQPDRVLRGTGVGLFHDVTDTWLPDHEPGFTLALAPFDADFDGDTDLYVANDSVANLMLINEITGERGAFVDQGLIAGVAVNPDGLAEAGMGVAVGDVDRDGRFDFAVTNFSDEPTQLYFGAARGFQNQSYRIGLAHETRRLLSWSAHLVDFDGDGWLELFTTNGHVFPQADEPGTGTRYGQADTLWRLGPLSRVERRWPTARDSILLPQLGTRGAAVGDVDGDGAPDLVLVRIDGPCALGINRLGPDAHRLVVRCVGDPDTPGPKESGGRRSPADAKGAKVIVVLAPEAGDEYALLGEVQTCRGFQSASSDRLHFGLGDFEEYADLKVLWPSGRVDELGPGRADRTLVIREGRGIVSAEALP
ncbi:MAG: CRTAC1 family protein [Planctomycetota bacterium]|nr:CRTAC1 family protein [Planctomycetota bacterium]